MGLGIHPFTILGIELVDSPTEKPHLWFPNTDPAWKHVIVHLSPQPLDNARVARWQLAHECLHLLDPRLPPTNVLEEGLATWYQNKAVPVTFAPCEPYIEAERLVYPLMDELPAAIRLLRKAGYRIGGLTAEQLQEVCPQILTIHLRRVAGRQHVVQRIGFAPARPSLRRLTANFLSFGESALQKVR